MNPLNQSEHTIIGGGIVGLMLAHYLNQSGVKVTVVDPSPPGHINQASFGNAGRLAFASYRPIAEPGLWWQGLSMLWKKDSVVRIPWSYRLAVLPWLLRLLRESSYRRSEQNAAATAELNALSKKCWDDIIQDHGLHSLVSKTGWLKLFSTDKAFTDMDSQLDTLDQHDLHWQKLSAEEVYQLEPNLGPGIKHGFLQQDSILIKQPHRLIETLAQSLAKRGVKFLVENISDIRKIENGLELCSVNGSIHTQKATVCSGAWSQKLLENLGDRFPLESERGYHLMFRPTQLIGHSIMHVEEHIVLSPMIDGLRMTTGEEFAGLDTPPDYKLIHAKLPSAKALLPNFDFSVQAKWLGFRPSLPDSKPIIDRHPTMDNLFLGFGHGHLGMTQSAATGKLLADLILNNRNEFNIRSFRANRF